MHEREDPERPTATEFVTEEFETSVSEEEVDAVAETVSAAVSALRSKVGDDRLEELLRDGEGSKLKNHHTRENEDPEPVTREGVVGPLFEALGYPDPAVEAGDLSGERGKQADYAFSLREYDDIDSGRLLVEAEPLNKRLDQDRHGLGQVRDWLDRRTFDADFGIATDGMRWVLVKYDRDTYSYDTLAEVNLQRVFVAAFENLTGRNVGLDEWVEGDSRAVLADFVRSFGYENFVSIAGEARSVIKRKRAEITDEFYDEYVRYVFGIRSDGEAETTRSLAGDGVVVPEEATGDDVRLFSVELMNRLVFIKFLEDKRLVDPDLLEKLVADHEGGRHPGTFYKTYLEPLFFGILDEKPRRRTGRIRDIDVYSEVPYLNGGLFRPTTDWDGDVTERDFDVRDSVLLSIVDLLERHDFSADGGPTDLDPSVLGNVFEKTINHITGDAGDQKKELGAYYTPDEITRFCADETVQPALLERFKSVVVEERGWPEAEVAQYDDVYELVASLPRSADLMDALLAEIDEFRALDPACGSGHFLTSVQSELVGVRRAIHDRRPTDDEDGDPPTWKLHKRTVVRNVYGVDIVSPAVEIAKLRLWLSIIAEVDPEEVAEYDDEELALPNVVFNVRQGNSLIGYTDLMETSADSEQARLDAWGPDTVRQKYGDIIDLVEQHKATNDTEEASEYLRRAEDLLDEYRDDLDEKVLLEFQEAGIEDIDVEQVRDYQPFHWVLEFAQVYADGGFDVIVGNPPWDVITSDREDYFSTFDSRFRTRSSEEKEKKREELLKDDEIAAGWEQHKRNAEIQAKYFNHGPSYDLQSPSRGGQGKNDLSLLFLERVISLSANDGYVSQILPGKVFTGTAAKDLRQHLLDETAVEYIVSFENNGIFPDIDNRYKFGVLVFEGSGTTEELRGKFQQRDIGVLENPDVDFADIPREVLENYAPKTGIFPQVESNTEVSLLKQVIDHPPISDTEDDNWFIDIYKEELNRTRDKDRFVSDKSEGDYPVYGGKQIYQYSYDNSIITDLQEPEFWSIEEEKNPEKSAKHRIREKNSRRLKKALFEAFDGSGSQKQFVNGLLEEHRDKPQTLEDVLLDCTEYRLGFREIANATNERSFIATALPKGIVCHHKLPTIRPYEIDPSEEDLEEHPLHSVYERVFTDQELFVALGLLNSLPFDYLIRTKLDTSLSMNMLEESQMPRLTDGDDWFHYISERAARLNCYGEAFAEMRERLGGIDPATDPQERQRLQAEIDAAAFHAYGLDREETRFVLDDFHRVRDPRLMTEAYFDLVAETYDELAEAGPMD